MKCHIFGYIGTRITFIKETDKYCDVIYKNYNNLEEAKANCKDDKVCIAIVDEKCNNLGLHNLCTKISNSSSNQHIIPTILLVVVVKNPRTKVARRGPARDAITELAS